MGGITGDTRSLDYGSYSFLDRFGPRNIIRGVLGGLHKGQAEDASSIFWALPGKLR